MPFAVCESPFRCKAYFAQSHSILTQHLPHDLLPLKTELPCTDLDMRLVNALQARGFVQTVTESAFCLHPDFRDVLFSITKTLLNVGPQSKG